MIEGRRFRKKPVVIDAVQWRHHGDDPRVEAYGYRRSGDSPMGASICLKCNQQLHLKMGNTVYHTHGWIGTPEGGNDGAQVVCPGDWIITGVKGECYPCKPDIFAATYEPAE